jgi:ribonuclease HII
MPVTIPTLEHEERLWRQGYARVAGVDEVGRGALAGPVMAGAVIVPCGAPLDGIWSRVRDSKLLTAAQREEMAHEVTESALAWGVGSADVCEIDAMGISAATRIAMTRAIAELLARADYLLIDWVRLDAVNIAQESHVKADARIVSVAAASILAKVARDRWMCEQADHFTDYQFAANKGYGTAAHLDAITRLGGCPLHRMSFAPFRAGLFQ